MRILIAARAFGAVAPSTLFLAAISGETPADDRGVSIRFWRPIELEGEWTAARVMNAVQTLNTALAAERVMKHRQTLRNAYGEDNPFDAEYTAVLEDLKEIEALPDLVKAEFQLGMQKLQAAMNLRRDGDFAAARREIRAAYGLVASSLPSHNLFRQITGFHAVQFCFLRGGDAEFETALNIASTGLQAMSIRLPANAPMCQGMRLLMATVLQSRGRQQELIATLAAHFEADESWGLVGHHAWQRSVMLLAISYDEMGQVEQAARIVEKLESILRANDINLGVGAQIDLSTLRGGIAFARGNLAVAEAELAPLSHRIAAMKAPPAIAVRSLTLLAQLRERQGNSDEAAKLQEDAAAIRKTLLLDGSPATESPSKPVATVEARELPLPSANSPMERALALANWPDAIKALRLAVEKRTQQGTVDPEKDVGFAALIQDLEQFQLLPNERQKRIALAFRLHHAIQVDAQNGKFAQARDHALRAFSLIEEELQQDYLIITPVASTFIFAGLVRAEDWTKAIAAAKRVGEIAQLRFGRNSRLAFSDRFTEPTIHCLRGDVVSARAAAKPILRDYDDYLKIAPPPTAERVAESTWQGVVLKVASFQIQIGEPTRATELMDEFRLTLQSHDRTLPIGWQLVMAGQRAQIALHNQQLEVVDELLTPWPPRIEALKSPPAEAILALKLLSELRRAQGRDEEATKWAAASETLRKHMLLPEAVAQTKILPP